MASTKVKVNGQWLDVGFDTPIDQTPTASSSNAVASGGVKSALDLKQDLLPNNSLGNLTYTIVSTWS